MPPRTGRPGRPRKPYLEWPEGSAYATVSKTYRKGRVAAVERKLVHGTQEDLDAALATSSASGKVNTAFVERHNGTDRCHNARKVRKTYEFSRDLAVHAAVTWWVLFCYNFHHTHRSLRLRLDDGGFLHRTPAMLARLAVEPLAIADIITRQVPGFAPSSYLTPEDFGIRLHGPAP